MQSLQTINIPEHAIARYPMTERTHSRLMVVDLSCDQHHHHRFDALPTLLQPGDLLVMNNTQVIPSRLLGRKASGGKVECFIEHQIDAYNAMAFIKSNRSAKAGTVIAFGKHHATLIEKQDAFWHIRFDDVIATVLDNEGHVPIPPYLKRDDEALDQERYQTVYAKTPGAVAAPTAGLHFDAPLLATLEQHGIKLAFVTLHVGSGTFKTLDLSQPLPTNLHQENYHIPDKTAYLWQQTRQQGGRVIAVGTTSLRTLESAYCHDTQTLQAGYDATSIFIKPGDSTPTIDGLITNFHLPDSSLILLVAALMGCQRTRTLYEEALATGYRFYSYGDAMLILKQGGHHAL